MSLLFLLFKQMLSVFVSVPITLVHTLISLPSILERVLILQREFKHSVGSEGEDDVNKEKEEVEENEGEAEGLLLILIGLQVQYQIALERGSQLFEEEQPRIEEHEENMQENNCVASKAHPHQ